MTDRQPPRLPLHTLTTQELEDAAAFYREFADGLEEDVDPLRDLAGPQVAEEYARSATRCRQEAAVCELLASIDGR